MRAAWLAQKIRNLEDCLQGEVSQDNIIKLILADALYEIAEKIDHLKEQHLGGEITQGIREGISDASLHVNISSDSLESISTSLDGIAEKIGE